VDPVAMDIAINMMRQIMMACGGVTLEQVDRYAESFARGVVATYINESHRRQPSTEVPS
jgi:hypothetical protein